MMAKNDNYRYAKKYTSMLYDSSTWSTAELNKKDNGMYLAGTRGPLTHKNHLRGSPPMFASNPLLCSASETNSRKLVALMCEKVKTTLDE